ncbi:MAG TPA: hypothetical protein VGN81_07050 [Pseudonocardiaceae bacterium]
MPAGTPTVQASVTPASTIDVARPTAAAPTKPGTTVSATARNPALATAASRRVDNRIAKFVVSAPTT